MSETLRCHLVIIISFRCECSLLVKLFLLLSFLGKIAFFLSHKLIFRQHVVDNIHACCFKLSSALRSKLKSLFGQLRSIFDLFFSLAFCRLSNSRVLLLGLCLQLVDVERAQFVSQLSLTSLSELEISFLIVNDYFCDSLFALDWLTVNLELWITEATKNTEHILEVLGANTFASFSIDYLPKFLEKLIVIVIWLHISWQKA